MNTLPPEHQSRIDRELREDETVCWAAQPSFRVLWARERKACLIFTVLVGVATAMLVLIAMVYLMAGMEPDPGAFHPSTGFFVLAGMLVFLLMLAWPLTWLNCRRVVQSTIYAVTNKRAMIITIARDGTTTMRGYRGDELIHLARIEYPNGAGVLVFESARGAGFSTGTAIGHRFKGIEDVVGVEHLLRDLFGGC